MSLRFFVIFIGSIIKKLIREMCKWKVPAVKCSAVFAPQGKSQSKPNHFLHWNEWQNELNLIIASTTKCLIISPSLSEQSFQRKMSYKCCKRSTSRTKRRLFETAPASFRFTLITSVHLNELHIFNQPTSTNRPNIITSTDLIIYLSDFQFQFFRGFIYWEL